MIGARKLVAVLMAVHDHLVGLGYRSASPNAEDQKALPCWRVCWILTPRPIFMYGLRALLAAQNTPSSSETLSHNRLADALEALTQRLARHRITL